MLLADVILPTLMTHGVVWLALLIPVIFAEAGVLSSSMRWRYAFALKKSASANVISTLVGFPLAYLAACAIGAIAFCFGTLIGPHFAAALEEYTTALLLSGYMATDATKTGAFITLLFVPIYWYLSSVIEFMVIRRSLPSDERPLLRRASFKMNAFSYSALGVLLVAAIFSL